MRNPVLTFTDRGIFCPDGGFHIDPHRPVDRALFTHGHSDHARPGHGACLATHAAAPVIRHRLRGVRLEGVGWGEALRIGGVTVSFHPAGHVPGSAQIRVARAGEVWVVSGDYKVEPDGLSEPFEPVTCHSFITECTFGLPLFRWRPNAAVMADIAGWWQGNAAQGRPSLITAYALGKAQRIMAGLPGGIGPILTHGAVTATTQVLRDQGYALPETRALTPDLPRDLLARSLIIAPAAPAGMDWQAPLAGLVTAGASGWLAVRALRRQRGGGQGFVLSDHADWPGLLSAIAATGADRVFATHGFTTPFSRYLRETGITAEVVETGLRVEGEDG